VRSLLKRVAERALIASGVATAARASRRGDILILAYHNVLPDGARVVGDTSLHLSRREFVRQLDALVESHDVVPLASVSAKRNESQNRPRVVITFDDAYVGALTVALPELARRKLPSTVFVAPGLLGTETWWDRVADPSIGAVRAELRDRLLIELQGEGSAIKESMIPGAALIAFESPYRIGNEAELRVAASLAGVSLGSHTWSHSNLSSLASAQLDHELAAPHVWLSERFATYVPWLSYPYGLFSPEVERVAAATGYVGSLMVAGGWLGNATPAVAHRVPRFNVPANLSLNGFRLRLSGLGAR
jgi:peptidoglycan/xylan/chitin deacetylase (PgdA/CDA1 family)